MIHGMRLRSARKAVVAGLAALTLVGAAGSIDSAQALPVAHPAAIVSGGPGMQGVDHVYYRRYYGYRRYGYRPFRRYYGYRGYGRPLPCRGGSYTHLSKRYC